MNAKIPLLLALFAGTAAHADEDDGADDESSSIARVQVIVLATSRTYEGTRREAMTVAENLGFAFSDRDLVYDDVKGLRWPDNYEDEMWAGGYVPRRYDEACEGRGAKNGCITVETSDAYPGLTPGYFVAVAGLLGDPREAKERLAEVRQIAPDAMLVETKVYVGCLH